MVSAGSKKLRVLFLSQRFLYPMDTGGKIRTGKLLEHLSKTFDITLVSNVESPKDDPYLPLVKHLCTSFCAVPWKENKKYSLQFYLRVLLNTLSRYPVTVKNDYSRELETALLRLVEERTFDLLICDFLQPSLNFRKLMNHRTILFEHNVESMIVRRHFEHSSNLATRLFWWSQWRKMRAYEKTACQRFTGIVTVSQLDKKILEEQLAAQNTFDIPTGIDTDYFSPSQDGVDNSSLVFTGAMDWLPNEDAIAFFAREILPRIKEKVPDIRLTVVGRNPSRHLLGMLKNYPEVKAAGWVEDVRPYVRRAAVYVIPLRIGGGTRIKLYEAMGLGKGIVSTQIGAEGLPVIHGENIILADQPHDFAAAVVDLLTNSKKRQRLAENARQFVVSNFSWQKSAHAFAEICRSVV